MYFSNYALMWAALALASYRLRSFYFFWVGLCALRIFDNPMPPPLDFLDPGTSQHDAGMWQAILDSSAAMTFAHFTVLWLAGSALRPTFCYFLPAMALLNSALLIFGHPGLLMTATMSGCLGACLFPLVDSKLIRAVIIVSLVCIHKAHPVICLLLGGIALRPTALWLLATPALYFIPHTHWLTLNGRLEAWTASITWWILHGRYWLGEGLGSYSVIGNALTATNREGRFIWLHSDWLQAIFEGGFLSFSLMLFAYFHALWRVRTQPGLRAAWIVVGVWGLANMPLRFNLSALLVAFLWHWTSLCGSAQEGFLDSYLDALRKRGLRCLQSF